MALPTDLTPQTEACAGTPAGRLAVVDVGSNAVRTTIAEFAGAGSGEVAVIEAHREPVRLGGDVFLTGRVSPQKLDELVVVLTRFRERCDALGVGRIACIATAAVRDAANRDELVARVRDATGLEVRVVSPSEEARLLTTAVKKKVDLAKGRSLLVDLGGGSVEVSIVEDGELVHSDSYRLGALRVLQALEGGRAAATGKTFLDLVDEYVRSLDDRIRDHLGDDPFDRYVATGGNVDSIADLLARESRVTRRDGVDACRLDDVRDLTARLAALGFQERMQTYALRPDRADTILQAAVVYYRLGRIARVDTVLVPRVGMRDGLLEELVAECAHQTLVAHHRESLVAACRALGRRYHADAAHAETVRSLAVELFDGTAPLHGLVRADRDLLEAAALLHDIGVFVANTSHHKHAWYLIRSSDLPGLDDKSREVVAQVARYHRRAHPSRKHAPFDELSAAERERVRRLAALLRIADGLDRSHRGKVTALELSLDATTLRIRPRAREDLALERLGLAEKCGLFETVFCRKVVLEDPTS
ncbi:MAG: Ppx/GppA family phosphatase [Planctomycetes bacterium]|nr:Ppx/GppA family phosphatase [Planctomycetota bacterium]